MFKWNGGADAPLECSTKAALLPRLPGVWGSLDKSGIVGTRRGRRAGEAALASKGPAGPKFKLDPAQTDRLVDALLEGPAAHGYKTQLWTLPRVAGLIEHLTGVRYHPGHVWRVLGSLGFSCQRPERRAVERDEKAIRQWKRVQWPEIKKKRTANAD